MVGYILAGRRRRGIFEFRCKKKQTDYLKLKKKSATKNNNCCENHIKHFDLAILGGGGGACLLPLESVNEIVIRGLWFVGRRIVARGDAGSQMPFYLTPRTECVL